MRPVWTGSIGFGMVNIPVKLFSATESAGLDLDMLDKNVHSNIKFKRVNEQSGKEVPCENIVKGFKMQGEYVILDDRAYFLLKEALLQSGKVGLGTFVMRNKENLAVVIPTKKS